MLFGKFRKIDPVVIAVLAAFALVLVGFWATSAKAADKGKPAASASDVPYMPPAATGWTGCGVGVHAGRTNADTATDLGIPGFPINIGANGTKAGGEVYCDANFGVFLVGAFVSYDWVWGDLHTLGVDNDLTVGGRAGVLVSQSALVYGHAGWSQIGASGPAAKAGADNADGIKVGAGIEVKVPNAPFFLDLRYTHVMYDSAFKVGKMPIDVDADEIRLGLRYKFSTSR